MPAIFRMRLDIEDIGKVGPLSFLKTIQADESAFIRYEIADGTTDQAVPISTTTGIGTFDVIFITSDQAISWRVLAADTANALDANGFVLLAGTNHTALLLSNASGSTANVQLYAAGT